MAEKLVTELGRNPRYFNRELSWLKFNERVLAEAERAGNPLLERLKFLAIFESNLDEFYMVRASGLIEQYEAGITTLTPDGLNPEEQLRFIAEKAEPLRKRGGDLWEKKLKPELEKEGINIREYATLSADEKAALDVTFHDEIYPVCTPLMLDPAPSVPFISNRSLNLAVSIQDESGSRLARVKVPSLDKRLIRIGRKKFEFVLLEDLIIANIATLFPGAEIKGVYRFRVIRDADIEIRELEAADLVTSVEQTLRLRRFGHPVLLEITEDMPDAVRATLMRLLTLEDSDVFKLKGLLGLEALFEIAGLDKANLKYEPHQANLDPKLADGGTLLAAIRKKEILLHHPFDSFKPVQTFIDTATKDESVVGIKQTMYRVGRESPIVESLLDAAEQGKQVAVMVELKARFDESNNLVWAKALERAGVHVSYGFAELKTHCKLCLVVRREPSGIQMYAHIGTGNYNPLTARTYTDLGLFTCDEDVTQDILQVFNYLTGYSKKLEFKKMLVAPLNLREGIIERIEREMEHQKEHGDGRIIFKLNSLVDPEVTDTLYEASEAGVSIDLIVRGICCLRPGLPGMSENIRVRSIVGRFLEHSRVYYFHNHSEPEAYIGSADLMRRNLDRRVETLVPVGNIDTVRYIARNILEPYLKDMVGAWLLNPDGSYTRAGTDSLDGFSAQRHLMQN